MQVLTRQGSILLLLVEVTGTESMSGSTYWLRPDKLDYAKNHPDEDVWIILHYAQPQEKFIFIKPDLSSGYTVSNKVIRGATEHFVEFTDSSPVWFHRTYSQSISEKRLTGWKEDRLFSFNQNPGSSMLGDTLCDERIQRHTSLHVIK